MVLLLKGKKLRQCAAAAAAAAILVSCIFLAYDARRIAAGAGYIKWVDFTPSYEVMRQALNIDIQSHETDTPVSWIELLAYAAAKNGGNFKNSSDSNITKLYERIKSGEDIEAITADLKYYDYYYKAYSAVLKEYVGYTETESGPAYGLKVYSPIAAGYYYSHYDDFGASRSYGYKRRHLGHDMMGSVGTPIVAVEGGTVEALGWNQYGGWRIGIRSFDSQRYYYYAHLRKNSPYAKGLKQGDTVEAGQLIGYLGMTGYSANENVNNINTPHLHFGIQLIFDESQKDGVNQIWIDVYDIVRLLERSKSKVNN